MTLRRTFLLLVLLGAAALWIAVAPIWFVGDMGVCTRSVLPLLRTETVSFDSTAWRTSDSTARGQMLMDLAQQLELENQPAAAITELLGPHECYVNYDDEPCYYVELDGSLTYLAMSVAHSGQQRGNVLRVRLTQDPSSFIGGC